MQNNVSVFLTRVPWVVAAILLGMAGCLLLYKGDYRKFFTSALFIKAIMWLPLYVIFCLATYSYVSAIILALLIAAGSVYEWVRHGKASVSWYLVFIIVGCIVIPLSLVVMSSRLWMTVVMASVLSDVFAFFFGKTIGYHYLPYSLNNRKTVEGVIGQIIGGVIGIMITSTLFGASIPWWLGLSVGLLSASGDLANSFAKRKLDITDWGKTIPGHGGVMDRFSSLNAVIIGTTLLLM